jgi:phosphohistidine phosphatase
MLLVLFRHAKAEKGTAQHADCDRQLTVKGQRKAWAAAGGLRRLLRTAAGVQVWASPALRSRQTANILAQALGDVPVQEHPGIYSGDLPDLAEQWRQASDGHVLVIVGHEPHLSDWARQLAGVVLPFKKCSAACFAVRCEGDLSVTFRWYADAKALAHIGDWTTSEE